MKRNNKLVDKNKVIINGHKISVDYTSNIVVDNGRIIANGKEIETAESWFYKIIRFFKSFDRRRTDKKNNYDNS